MASKRPWWVWLGAALVLTTFLMMGASNTPLGNAGGIVLSIAATIFVVALSRA